MDKVFLLGSSGIYIGQKIPIEDEIILGRDSSVCQLVYEASEKMVSGVQCKVKIIDNVIQLIDMGSTNGTYLDNGVRLTPYEPQILDDGQGFYLGDKMNSFTVCTDRSDISKEQKNASADTKDNKERSGIGISITSITLGILAVIISISYLFIDFAIYPAIIFSIISLALGAISLFLHFKGKFMALVGTIASGLLIVFLIAGTIIGSLKPVTVAGTWTCDEVNTVKTALRNAIENGLTEAGLNKKIADYILNFTGMDDDVIFTFFESGKLSLGNENGIDLSSDILSWEDTGDNHIRFTISLKDIQILGTSLPVEFGYRAEYNIKGDTMTLDFFGHEVVLKRK